jgi:phage-related protein
MPVGIRHDIGVELMRVQFGGQPTDFKSMPTIGAGAYEIRVRDESGVFRAIYYVAKFARAIYVLHAFRKTTQQTAKSDIELARVRYKMIRGKT